MKKCKFVLTLFYVLKKFRLVIDDINLWEIENVFFLYCLLLWFGLKRRLRFLENRFSFCIKY